MSSLAAFLEFKILFYSILSKNSIPLSFIHNHVHVLAAAILFFGSDHDARMRFLAKVSKNHKTEA